MGNVLGVKKHFSKKRNHFCVTDGTSEATKCVLNVFLHLIT